MARKFVTGDAKNVVITHKRKPIEAACQSCGKKVTIMSDHVGDILCPECMEGRSYSLMVEDDDGNKD